MPLLPGEALSAGLVDAVLYEDELPGFCCARETPADGMPRSSGSEALSSTTNGRPGFLTWHEAEGRLRRPVRWTTRQRVGVVAVEGMIIPGRSRRFPAPIPLVNRMAGAVTIVQRLRAAEADKRIAAVVLYVDSPGGAALESDLIWREVRRLRSRKPVVVLMGAQAASGGYYVAASANWIVCRPATLTGSIGIWGGKPVIGGLLDRLQVRTEVVQRGSMAGMYSAVTRFAPEERARVERDQRAFYDRFKAVVAEGRNMTETQIEAAARGRVWTGAQALDVGLVDQLGGFQDALEKAKELAGIAEDVDITVVSVSSPQHARLPASFEPDETGGVSRVFSDMWSLWATPRLWALAPWVAVIR